MATTAMKISSHEDVVDDEPPEYETPPPIFLSYQWGHQAEAKLIRKHLEMAGYDCWMDVGQMGGGDKLFAKIDTGIRAAKVVVCCVTEKYAQSPNCNREVNLSVSLGKPIIPLLVEKMSWPPPGSMGPIFSEYLFIRFFARGGEEMGADGVWAKDKFQELLMQLSYNKIMPDEDKIKGAYMNWWEPPEEVIVVSKKEEKYTTAVTSSVEKGDDQPSPELFISYQWGKQKQIKLLYKRLSNLGYNCWMDIYQMGGGDSLYDKIDRGIRGCKVVVSIVTPKYAMSANCRREVSLCDALKKPVVPLLLEDMTWPPSGPMSMVFTQLLYIDFHSSPGIQETWRCDEFDQLISKIRQHIPDPLAIEESKSSPPVISQKEDATIPLPGQDHVTAKQIESETRESSTPHQVTKTESAKNMAVMTNETESENNVAVSPKVDIPEHPPAPVAAKRKDSETRDPPTPLQATNTNSAENVVVPRKEPTQERAPSAKSTRNSTNAPLRNIPDDTRKKSKSCSIL